MLTTPDAPLSVGMMLLGAHSRENPFTAYSSKSAAHLGYKEGVFTPLTPVTIPPWSYLEYTTVV